MTKTGDLLQYASRSIPRNEALLLLAKALDCTKETLIAHPEKDVPPVVENQYKIWINRVEKGFPATYILGVQSFWGYDFSVTPAVLIPRPDTETLIETVLQLSRQSVSPSILDLGTGSGAIAVTLALAIPSASVTATDISPDAIAVAKANASRLNARITFLQSNWFDAIDNHQQFDYIVSNPPYIHPMDPHLKRLAFEPLSALTDHKDGLACFRAIIGQASSYLSQGGTLVLEHGFDQGEAVRMLFAESGDFSQAKTVRDLGGNERVTYAAKRNQD